MKFAIGANDDDITSEKILEAARAQVRRFGEGKTNVVDIARALGTSHTTIYRHFRSKNDVFNAIVASAMRDEEELARAYVNADGPAPERLSSLVVALHDRKRQRLEDDSEIYSLYRRVVDEYPELVGAYTSAMTSLIAEILASGVSRGEFKIDNIDAAAAVVRDAVTVYVHPVHVEAAVRSGISTYAAIENTMKTLTQAFAAGVAFAPRKRHQTRS